MTVVAACGGSESTDTTAPPATTTTAATTTTTSTTSTTMVTTTTTTTTTMATTTTLDTSAPFRDEFDAPPEPPWTWVNEDPDMWAIVDGRLELTAGPRGLGPGSLDILSTNALTRPVPDAGTGRDYAVETLVFVEPDFDFEQAGVFLLVDGDTYVNLVAGFCGPCGVGRSVFLEVIDGGESLTDGIVSVRVPNGVDRMRLRIETSPDGNATVAVVSWGPDGGDWQQLGGVIRDMQPFTTMGIQAANLRGPDASERPLVASFDWFELQVYG